MKTTLKTNLKKATTLILALIMTLQTVAIMATTTTEETYVPSWADAAPLPSYYELTEPFTMDYFNINHLESYNETRLNELIQRYSNNFDNLSAEEQALLRAHFELDQPDLTPAEIAELTRERIDYIMIRLP